MLNLDLLYRAIEDISDQTIVEYQSLIKPSRPTKSQEAAKVNSKTKESAVMILLYPKLDKLHFALIQRPRYDGTHGGQVSLPGGKIEPTDENLTHTAIRETYEEIGFEVNEDQIITGFKPIYIPPSNFMVYPFLAYSSETPDFKKDDYEVEEVLEIELIQLTKETIKETSLETQNNLKLKVTYYELNEKVVWGATATILAELNAILDEYRKMEN